MAEAGNAPPTMAPDDDAVWRQGPYLLAASLGGTVYSLRAAKVAPVTSPVCARKQSPSLRLAVPGSSARVWRMPLASVPRSYVLRAEVWTDDGGHAWERGGFGERPRRVTAG